jgi:SAM-dependent methyltransferase
MTRHIKNDPPSTPDDTIGAVYWDQKYARGKLAFLHDASEQPRFMALTDMIKDVIRQRGVCEIADIGCGEGLLVPYIRDLPISCYIAIDISSIALQSVPAMPCNTRLICRSLAEWDGAPAPDKPRILIASEILYYESQGPQKLLELAKSSDLHTDLLVSCVAGRPDKPNWQHGSIQLWRRLRATGLKPVDFVSPMDEKTETRWNIARYDLTGCTRD